MDLQLAGKVAIITGSSKGLGRATALALAAEGVSISLCARGAETLEETRREIESAGGRARATTADLNSPEGCEAVFAAAMQEFGRVDILVNNVGGADRGDTDDVWLEAYERNLLAAVRMCRLVVPVMKENGGGAIVHVASIWGRESGGGMQYNAAKAAMISHAKNLALQLGPDNIRVNAVCPGSIRFPGGTWDQRAQADPEGMAKFVEDNIAMGRFGRAEEVADVITFLCSDRASWVTGAAINIDGGQSHSNI
ncbi:MAG: SDR family NAD(P)-dependent oxidoreductase [Dehalococcoidia bacterium]